MPEFQGTSWTEWANKREFHSADLALRSLQTNLFSFQAANSCSEEDLRLLECAKAAYRLDPEVEVLFPAFLRDFPKILDCTNQTYLRFISHKAES